MKKINSNGYAGGWIVAGLVPIALAGILEAVKIVWDIMIPTVLIKVLVAVGTITLLGFGLLLAVELTQDRRLNAYYLSKQHTKLPLATGFYECQSCGCQQVRRKDATCHACGVTFRNDQTQNRSIPK